VKTPVSTGLGARLSLLLALSLSGCLQDPVSLSSGRSLEVQLRVTGGVAGVDFTLSLDGSSGVLRGVSCVNQCDFQDGEVLQTLSEEELDHLRSLFDAARIRALDGQDFGSSCCDHFHADLDYRDDRGASTVRGSLDKLPESLRLAVATLQSMASGTHPVIVAFETDPLTWPRDPYQIMEASVHGHTLQVRLAYGGGCRAHDLQAVAWGGWMESDPVQVKLFLSHEDFDDPCDAWITREVSVDLVPLRSAYRESYGSAGPGETTLVLLLEDPLLAGPLGARRLEYVF